MRISTRGPETADLTLRAASRVRRLFATRLSARQRGALTRLARCATQSGTRVFLVGGVVRDLLLGRPVRDLDLAVEGDARELARRVGGRRQIHEAFGTATVECGRGLIADLASMRRERYRSPAALPDVGPGTLQEDLARRDFALNTLAVPLGGSGPLGLIDPFGGLDDIRRKRVRVLHERSFIDDPTRAFRAVRFAAELGFELERRTARLLRDGVGFVDLLSAARLRRELTYTLGCGRPGRAVRLLVRFGLLETVAPGLRPPRNAAICVARLPRLVRWLREGSPSDPPVVWAVALALLLRTVEGETVRQALGRLQPDRGVRRAVLDALEADRRLPRALARPGLRPSRIHAVCRRHGTEALLAVLAGGPPPKIRAAVRCYLATLRDVRADVRGADLLRAGLPPGPSIARALDAALAAKLDGLAPRRRDQLRVALASSGRP